MINLTLKTSEKNPDPIFSLVKSSRRFRAATACRRAWHEEPVTRDNFNVGTPGPSMVSREAELDEGTTILSEDRFMIAVPPLSLNLLQKPLSPRWPLEAWIILKTTSLQHHWFKVLSQKRSSWSRWRAIIADRLNISKETAEMIKVSWALNDPLGQCLQESSAQQQDPWPRSELFHGRRELSQCIRCHKHPVLFLQKQIWRSKTAMFWK